MKTSVKDSIKNVYLLEEVAYGRLSPKGIISFFWGATIFSLFLTIISFRALNVESIEPIWSLAAKVNIIVLGIQILITLLFSNQRLSYKLQKLQLILGVVTAFKFSIEFYLIFFLQSAYKNAPSFIFFVGAISFIGGILFLLLSVIRGAIRLKQGHFKKGGSGLYNFKESKPYVSIPIIFAFSIMGGLIGKASASFSDIGLLAILLITSIFLQFAVAMALPELILLAYCKFKYKSFNKIPKYIQGAS
ncbi:hypothetical protein [Aquibacillus kalidii]|uniref:hypothetical protein n=1 Tax=Aquibacillus kalidii TaxID=2762597 RepID=UPI001645A1F0|nr:hypothetical protein [Aquibacillus kalidii]